MPVQKHLMIFIDPNMVTNHIHEPHPLVTDNQERECMATS